jgi:hypothetical protein
MAKSESKVLRLIEVFGEQVKRRRLSDEEVAAALALLLAQCYQGKHEHESALKADAWLTKVLGLTAQVLKDEFRMTVNFSFIRKGK